MTLGSQTFGTGGAHKVISQDRRLRGEVRNHGQQEVYEMVQLAVSRDGRDGGHKGYFLVNRIGYDVISLDPEHLIPNLNW